MKAWLGFLAILPVLAFPSGTTATSSDPPRNGLIAAFSSEGIQIVDPAGGPAHDLSETQEMGEPAWSPDGKSLALAAWGDEDIAVYTMSADGSDRRLVLRNAWSPAWSPDGKRLVVVRNACSDSYSCDDGSPTVLATVRADGTEVREVVLDDEAATGIVSSPKWSPDGESIAFIDQESRIKVVSVKGDADRVRQVATGAQSLAWSPDGSRIAFDRAVYERELSRQVVVVVDLATRKETVLRGPEGSAQSPTWSPDGTQLAFLSMKPSPVTGGCGGGGPMETRLWAMAPDGTKAHRIAKGFFFGTPAWARSLEPVTPTD
ncbi:MAG: hypothetical protein AABM30_08470 [Actinomycetota bacterium]